MPGFSASNIRFVRQKAMTNCECSIPPLLTSRRQVVYGSILYVGVKYPARCERAAEQRGNQFLRNAIILMASPQNLLLLHKPSAFLYFCPSLFHSISGRISTTRPKTCKMYSSFCKQKRIRAYCTMFSATTLLRKLRCSSFITQIIHSFYCSFMYSLVRH